MAQTLNYTIGADRRAFVKDIQNFKIDFADDNNNWVQARQFERGMRQVFVNIINEDGTPFDLTGCNVWFEGLLPENAKGDFRVIDDTGFVPIDLQNGQFRFDLPGHAFTVAGSYRQAFFRIVKNGNSVTTLEFDLEVLADKVIGGLVPKDWIGPFEEIADKLVDGLQKHTDDADKILSDFRKKVSDLIAQLNQQGSTTASMLTELQSRVDAIAEKAQQNNLFTQAEADAFKQSINQAIGNLANYAEPGSNLSDKLIAEADDRGINVRHFGVAADGKADDSQAIQNAIYKAVDLYPRVNTVVMPGGIYKIDHTLIVPPYIKMRSTGLATFVSSSPQAVAWIKWLGKRDPDIVGKPLGSPYYNADWQRGAIFGGGGFSFIANKNANNVAVVIGDDTISDPSKPISRFELSDLSISGFGTGIKINASDFYIAKFYNLHLENNTLGVHFAKGAAANSGENIQFENCTFAHHDDAAFIFDYHAIDLSLKNCSLDFNNNVFMLNCDKPNNNITLYGGNVEGNKRIFDNPQTVSDGWKPTLSIYGSVLLIQNELLDNPDTPQFRGPLNLNLFGAYINAQNNVKSLSYLCDSKVIVCRYGSLKTSRHDGNRYLLSENKNLITHGHNVQMSMLENGSSENGHVSVMQDAVMQNASLPSSFVFKPTEDAVNNWDRLSFKQKVNVAGKASYALSAWILFTNLQNSFTFSVKFWTNDGYLIRTDSVYFYDATPSDQAQFLRSAEFDVPYYADYATIDLTIVVKKSDSQFELGYLGLEAN